MTGFTCVSCKRYFYDDYFNTGLGGYYVKQDDGTLSLGGDATDGDIPYYYCAYCDRKGGDFPDNPFNWYSKVPWPYPEDLKK